MKTAMQELKEWVIKNKEHQQGSESGEQSVCYFEYCDFEELIFKIDTIAEQEKEQIKDAYFDGYEEGCEYNVQTADDYYNKTYNK